MRMVKSNRLSVVFIDKPINSISTCKTNPDVSTFSLFQKNKNNVNFKCLETSKSSLQLLNVNTDIKGIDVDGQCKKSVMSEILRYNLYKSEET